MTAVVCRWAGLLEFWGPSAQGTDRPCTPAEKVAAPRAAELCIYGQTGQGEAYETSTIRPGGSFARPCGMRSPRPSCPPSRPIQPRCALRASASRPAMSRCAPRPSSSTAANHPPALRWSQLDLARPRGAETPSDITYHHDARPRGALRKDPCPCQPGRSSPKATT